MSDDDAYGPPLPPGMAQPGPAKPVIGPVIPSSIAATASSSAPEPANTLGPSLPPARPATVGPTLPPGFTSSNGTDDSPGDSSDSDDGDIVGPALPGAADPKRDLAKANRMYGILTKSEDKAQKRDSWMTELPPTLGKAMFGLEARQFSQRSGSSSTAGQDKTWAESPAEKARREAGLQPETDAEDMRQEWERLERQFTAKEDARKAELAKKTDKRGSESLLDRHRKKLKTKSSKDEPTERRPFDRDVDLKVNQMDKAKRDALIRKSAELGDKFGRGKLTSSFL